MTGPTGPASNSPAFLTSNLQASATGLFSGLTIGATATINILLLDPFGVNGRPLVQGFSATTLTRTAIQGYRVFYDTVWTVSLDIYVLGSRAGPGPHDVEYTCYYAIVDYTA